MCASASRSLPTHRSLAKTLLFGALASIALVIALSAFFTRLLGDLCVVALIVGCAILAAMLPALRAARVHPAVALRYE